MPQPPRPSAAFHPGGDFADPRLSPLTANLALLRRFPPILTHVGGTECFVGDSERLHGRLDRAGVANRLIVSRGRVHSYVTLNRAVPEARLALRRAAAFLHSHMDGADARIGLEQPCGVGTRRRAVLVSLCLALVVGSLASGPRERLTDRSALR